MAGVSWLWGPKKDKPREVEYSVTSKEKVYMNNQVRVHLVLDIESPVTEDVANTLRNTKVDFLVPADCTIKDVKLVQIDYLNRGGS